MKFVNDRFQSSSSVMCAMLKKADLENSGFQKEITTKDVKEAGSDKSNFQVGCMWLKILICTFKGNQIHSPLAFLIYYHCVLLDPPKNSKIYSVLKRIDNTIYNTMK